MKLFILIFMLASGVLSYGKMLATTDAATLQQELAPLLGEWTIEPSNVGENWNGQGLPCETMMLVRENKFRTIAVIEPEDTEIVRKGSVTVIVQQDRKGWIHAFDRPDFLNINSPPPAANPDYGVHQSNFNAETRTLTYNGGWTLTLSYQPDTKQLIYTSGNGDRVTRRCIFNRAAQPSSR